MPTETETEVDLLLNAEWLNGAFAGLPGEEREWIVGLISHYRRESLGLPQPESEPSSGWIGAAFADVKVRANLMHPRVHQAVLEVHAANRAADTRTIAQQARQHRSPQ